MQKKIKIKEKEKNQRTNRARECSRLDYFTIRLFAWNIIGVSLCVRAPRARTHAYDITTADTIRRRGEQYKARASD